MTETRIVLRTILRHARVEPSRRRPERVAHHNVFIVPAGGGRVRLQRRATSRRYHQDGGASRARATAHTRPVEPE